MRSKFGGIESDAAQERRDVIAHEAGVVSR